MNNFNEKYITLKQTHKTLTYESFDIKKDVQTTIITYKFCIDDFTFMPTWTFSNNYFVNPNVDDNFLEYLVFHLGMAELISYWKCCCPQNILIRAGFLNEEQLGWWKKLYFNGLSEFFYTNGISCNINDFMTITSNSQRKFNFDKDKNTKDTETFQGFLIPVGGGKDSVVTMELLKGFKPISSVFIVNSRGATQNCAQVAGFMSEDCVTPIRKIDPLLLELNKQGYLNGHTPFSSVLAFSSYLFAYIGAKRYIPLSNESSANESYVKNLQVNHQYSKSTEFEEDFRCYVQNYLLRNIEYFSFLRPWNELRITHEFAKHPQYFPLFRSCNAGSKQDCWCGKCSKCLFVYIMLSSTLPPSTVEKIFGVNLLKDISLEIMFDSLVSPELDKPFECIGTREEINAAIYIAAEKYPETKEMPLYDYYFSKYTYSFNKDILNFYDISNFVPKKLHSLLAEPTYTKQISNWMANKKILILGFGREGRSTFDFIVKNKIPCKALGIADISMENINCSNELYDVRFHTGESYLDCAGEYDLIFKSPGISLKDKLNEYKDRITSQTDLSLRFCKNNVIGVTGTKGKSTTSSLIYHMLLCLGENVVLTGNIGIPPFSVLDEIKSDTLVVFELSSHQLEYVSNSPHISVLLNVYGEHLDHYLSYEHYKSAKYNVFLYQKENDFIIYNTTCDGIDMKIVEKSKGKKIRLSDKGFKENSNIYIDGDIYLNDIILKKESIRSPLIGEHTLYNILFALSVVQLLGLDVVKAVETLISFKPLSHRMEYIGEYGKRHFYNDSISTIPESAMCAVQCFKKVNTLIIGGLYRGIDYSDFAVFLAENSERIENVICMPESGYIVYDKVKDITNNIKLFKVENLEQAVETAKKITPEGGLCLLSPAAASYGYFKDFAARGEAFKNYVSKTYR